MRQATRAPDDRPPTTSGSSWNQSARSASITAVHATSRLAAGGGERRPGDAVGLLDERDGESRREGHILRRDEILRPDAATRAVPEHDDASAVVGLRDVGVRWAEGSAEHENRHAP